MKTLNSLEAYSDAGTRAGLARRRKDPGLVGFIEDWFRRAISLEKPENRPACRAAYEASYREETAPSYKSFS